MAGGGIPTLGAEEMLVELRLVIENLNGLTRCVYCTNHASNYLPLRGTLPGDKDRLLATLDTALSRGRDVL